jgi:hypothetical protein
MDAEDKVAVWGCSICANVWASSANQPIGYLWCALWLMFGVVIILASRHHEQNTRLTAPDTAQR